MRPRGPHTRGLRTRRRGATRPAEDSQTPSPPVRVLYLDATRSLYGASRMLLTLLENLCHPDDMVVPLVVLSNDVEDDLRLLHALRALGVRCWEYPLAVLRRQKYFNARGALFLSSALLRSSLFLLRLLRHYRVELVQTNTSTVLPGGIVARLARIPHIWHVHELFRRWEGRVLVPVIYALSDCIVVPSRAVGRNMIEAYPRAKRKIRVIPNGVELDAYSTVTAEGVGALREEWQLPAGSPVVGMVGRIGMWKGEYQFVEAAESVLRRVPEARFIIVGGVFDENNQHLEALNAYIKDKKLESWVLVAGLRGDVPVIMNLLDVLVHLPARAEPFGLVAIEAMAAACPVVAVDLGGLPEIVVHGQTGYLVPAGDVEGAARYTAELLENPARRESMGRAGRGRVEQEFSAAAYAARFSALYSRLRLKSPPETGRRGHGR